MAIVVRIPTPLQKFTRNQSEVPAHGTTVADVLDNLEEHFPGLRERLCDDRGAIRKFRGKLVGVDLSKFRQQVDESRSYLFQRSGYQLDIFSA